MQKGDKGLDSPSSADDERRTTVPGVFGLDSRIGNKWIVDCSGGVVSGNRRLVTPEQKVDWLRGHHMDLDDQQQASMREYQSK
jgi:hypothetical protein